MMVEKGGEVCGTMGGWCLGVVRLGYLVIDGVKLGEDDTIDGA